MRTRQVELGSATDPDAALAALAQIEPQLLLVFASTDWLERSDFTAALRRRCPGAHSIGCSTAGEISRGGVSEASAVVTAVHFDRPDFAIASGEHGGLARSADSGRTLARAFGHSDLHSAIVFAPGVDINGSALIDGITSELGDRVMLTGGLAGDGGAFERTLTLCDGVVSDRRVVAIGFYGESLKASCGTFGGWEAFGAARKITRCDGNLLYELDGEPALDLYERYLGDYAKDLPASGLLYPFEMLDHAQSVVGLVRTILGVDESTRSLTLAGSLIPDGYLKLMHASFENLVDGAERAAAMARRSLRSNDASLALLVSCVGRKLVMGDRIDEEVEAVADIFGRNAMVAGFYSYGEISPLLPSPACKLHNQTMAVTCLAERA
jgi:hypothetical protein